MKRAFILIILLYVYVSCESMDFRTEHQKMLDHYREEEIKSENDIKDLEKGGKEYSKREENKEKKSDLKKLSNCRFSCDAVDIWEVTLLYQEKNVKLSIYSPEVRLFINYRNTTNIKVAGLIVWCKIKSPLGKTLHETKFEDNTVIESGGKKKSDTFWKWEDNPYIDGQPFDKMWQVAKNGNAIIYTKIP